MKSFLAYCKTCKRHLQISATVADERAATRTATGKIISHKRRSWIVAEGKYSGTVTRLEAAWNGRWTISLPCPGCQQALGFSAVAGEVTGQDCNAKCMASHGPTCECSCGGVNHGKSHAI